MILSLCSPTYLSSSFITNTLFTKTTQQKTCYLNMKSTSVHPPHIHLTSAGRPPGAVVCNSANNPNKRKKNNKRAHRKSLKEAKLIEIRITEAAKRAAAAARKMEEAAEKMLEAAEKMAGSTTDAQEPVAGSTADAQEPVVAESTTDAQETVAESTTDVL